MEIHGNDSENHSESVVKPCEFKGISCFDLQTPLRAVKKAARGLGTPRQVARDCDWILCSSLARHMCFCIGKALEKRVGLLHLQPLAPTKAFPHYSREDCVDCILKNEPSEEYEETYWSLERYNYDFLEAISPRKPLGIAFRRTWGRRPSTRAPRCSASRSFDRSWRAPQHLECDDEPEKPAFGQRFELF